MENIKQEKESKESKEENSQKILRYPFNGRSNYLIDNFYIIGYNYSTITKYLYNDENFKNILSENKQSKENSSDFDLQKFNIKENPILLNEFSTNYEKDSMDIDTIMEIILPKKINLYFAENKILYSKSPEKKNTKGNNIGINNYKISYDDFCIFEENKDKINYKKELKEKNYNMIFSSNPQSGKNSKKSINGFSYIFYKKLKKEKNYLNKTYSFYIPTIFCIISEFPFYNSFYQLCQKFSYLFSSNNIQIPLEILLYNIIKLTPSPLNADIYLSLNSILNDNIIEENEENIFEKHKTFYKKEKEIKKNSMELNDIYLANIEQENKKKVFNKKKTEKISMKFKSKEVKEIKEINSNSPKELKIEPTKFISDHNLLEFTKKIKFELLTGYPLIQYNLAKVLMQTLSPIDVIIIFFYTFLEFDVIFFSKNLEFLSLIINSYLNLNFPLNDEKYYFNNVSVSLDNYKNQNSTFVGSAFTTIIGINDSYNSSYSNNNNKLKEHLVVDLDNGKLYKNEDKNNKEKSKKIKELFSFIKNVCKNKENKNDKTILQREIEILYTTLQYISSNMNDDENPRYYNIYKLNSFMAFNPDIKKLNIQIQDSFYKLVNNISMYFYQNLSIKSEGDDIKLKKEENIINEKNEQKDMNVIFLEDYKDEKIYTKEELYFLEELRNTMKFQSFVNGFVQSYNPIDLYKIPLTFTEEFISFISRKSINQNRKINFFGLIDELYEIKKRKEIIIDFKDIIYDYNNNYRIYFNRIISENEIKKGISNIKLRIYNNKIIKYKSYELDMKILMKYLKILSDIKKKEENIFFYLYKNVENNIPKMISVTDIESIIENYSIDTNILSTNDLCCVNIIILFTLSLRYIKSLDECQPFLGTLFQNFIVFRKYYSIIMSMVYSLYEESIKKNNNKRAKDYFFLYYLCINSLRNFKLIPNENLMKIINKFNKINIETLNTNIENSKNNFDEIDKDNNLNIDNTKIKLYGIDLPEDPITTRDLYIIYNFTYEGSIPEKDILIKINIYKNNKEELNNNININEYMEPRIRFNNGIHRHESPILSQRNMLCDLVEQYKEYIIDMDENKLKLKINLDSCLNILLFMRNSKRFIDEGDVIDTVKKIFYIFLNQIEIKNMNK